MIIVLATAGIFVSALAIFALFVPKQFFPASDRPELLVDLHLSHNASFAATQEATIKLERLLDGHPGIEHISAYIGGGAPRFYLPLDVQTPDISRAQLVIQTRGEKAREEVHRFVEKVLTTEFPELWGRVSGLENGPPVGQPLQVRVTGKDHESIRSAAELIEGLLRRQPNLTNVNSDYGEFLKTAHVEVNQDKVRALGINYGTLKQVLAGSLDGAYITSFREGDKAIAVMARLGELERTNLANLPFAKIPTESGHYVPLSQIADLIPSSEPAILWRRNRQAAITVFADARRIQPNQAISAIRAQLDDIEKSLPKDVAITIGGAEEESAKSQTEVLAVIPAAIILICILLMAQLQSITKMALVLATGPLALIGVAVILAVFQIPFGFVAMLGSLSLFGMVIRNSVILIDRIDQLTTDGVDLIESVIEATLQRVRPILLTATAAILAMIPLTRSVFWGPMAWATMGGLLVATALTLIFLPALYLVVFAERDKLTSSQKELLK